MNFLFLIFIGILAIRTLAWHLKTWQIREYRFDRMRSYLRTKEGGLNFWNFWFFKGVFPSPKLSLRIILILLIVFALSFLSFFFLSKKIPGIFWLIFDFTNNDWYLIPLFLLAWERFLFFYVGFGVWISKFPVWIQQKQIYKTALSITKKSNKNIVRIAITGSYGKSSTKEILVHLLQSYFGKESIFFNPENRNNEIAIARQINRFSKFFLGKSSQPKFSIVEIGAYKRGEITSVCDFYAPHISILTSIGDQHIDLFGSQRNIQLGKFELAENTSKKVFFNADNKLLQEIFEDKKITATPIGISKNSAKNILAQTNQTEFVLYGQKTILPWPGEFFIHNALLAIECARELGIPKEKMPGILKKLPPLKRALSIKKNKKQKYTIFNDLYSANPNGVLSAINHLAKIPGKKLFFGIPLLELGKKSQEIHEQIFCSLKKIKAEVFWLKKDYSEQGKKILGKKFHQINSDSKKDLSSLLKRKKELTNNDGILFESRIPNSVLDIFG